MPVQNLIEAFLYENSPFSSIEVTGVHFSKGNIVVNINHGNFERTESYHIPILELLEFLWDKSKGVKG